MRCLGCMKEIADNSNVCGICGYIQSLPPKEPYHMTPGTILKERYLIGRVLGYGGFGVTYIGYDMTLNNIIAIKEYLPSEFSTRMPGELQITVYSGEKQGQFESGRSKFLDEAKRLAKFRNTDGIVAIYDVFELNSTSYIVMEYLEGETVKERLERCGRFTPDEAAQIMIPVMEALKGVHAEGIIHRDISPDNIYLLNDGNVRLLDFGAARYASANFSKSLSVILKQGYAPEEQYRSRGAQGEWSDVYALAATIYKMITEITPEDAIERTVEDNLKPPSKLGVDISENYENALLNALNVYREDRTQTVSQFMDEILGVKKAERHIASNKKRDIGKWKLWQKLCVGAFACAVVTTGVLFATGVIGFKHGILNDIAARSVVYVPDVLSKNIDQAKQLADEREIDFQIVDKQYSMDVEENLIMLQNPASGTKCDKDNSILGVTISAGRPIITIASYLGRDIDDVRSELTDAGLTVNIEEKESLVTSGTIIGQSVESGTSLRVGDAITLTVSVNNNEFDTSRKHELPDFSGMTVNDIDSMEAASFFTYKIETEYNPEVKKEIIFRQSVPAGTLCTEGSEITIYVSLGAEEIVVPDTQYKTLTEAQQIIREAGLTISIKYSTSDTVAEDHIIMQTPSAGSKAEKGAAITVYVSTGSDASSVENGDFVEELPVTEAPVPQQQYQQTVTAKAASPATTKTTTAIRATTSKVTASKAVTTAAPTTAAPVVTTASVNVPDLVGMTSDQAKTELRNAGLSVMMLTTSGGTKDCVMSQNPAAGNSVSPGTTIYIYVGEGEKETVYKFGDNITGVIDENGILKISGSGRMYDYSSYNEYYAAVSTYNIYPTGWSGVNSVEITGSIENIGSYAFYGLKADHISYNGNYLTEIGSYAFGNCELSWLRIIGGGASIEISNNAFNNLVVTDYIQLPSNTNYYDNDADYYFGPTGSMDSLISIED